MAKKLLNNKLIFYIGLIVSGLVIIGMFITATSYLQLVVAVISYPLFIYFGSRLFPYRFSRAGQQKALAIPHSPISTPKSKGGIADIDKRDFLKLIGTAGISFFLFSLFSRKKEIPFIGQMTGQRVPVTPSPDGDKIGTGPTDDYQITEIDEGAIAYYGFTDVEGAWFIMKEDSDSGSFRYSQGNGSFSQNWAKRENLKYDYFYRTF